MAVAKTRKHPWRENLETLTGAIVLALIFKAFLVEISRIPSPSMQPTLMGDPRNGLSDRVLVDKLSFRFRDPERWEIVVFKHPLERSRNMVKRVVGLPAEDLKIERGDVWVRKDTSSPWAIAHRPRSVQDEMWRDLDFEEPRISSWRAREGGTDWNLVGRDISAPSSGRARFRPDRSSVYDVYDDGYPDPIRNREPLTTPANNAVGDLRVEGAVEAMSGCELVAAHIVEGSRLYRFVIPGPAAPADAAPEIQVWSEATFLAGGGEALSITRGEPFRLQAGDGVTFAAQNIDDRLILDVDGDPVAEVEIEPVDVLRSYVEVEQVGGGADFTDLRVKRDIYYLPGLTLGQPTTIPDGNFYMLGDNTQGSADSREWVFGEYSVSNGEGPPVTVRGNFRQGENPSFGVDRSGNRAAFLRDEWGERHVLGADFEPIRNAPLGLVPRDLIRGRALAVFWPINLRLGIWRVSWLH